MNYQVENFDKFVDSNWSELVEYTEEATGELYNGLEPLLTKDKIIDQARELWDEEIES